jgi:polar amino acid transport system permease protein/octopine/nopaline transport system permease protein
MSWSLFLQAVQVVMGGLWLTVLVTLASFAVGQIGALPLAIARTSGSRLANAPALTFTFVMRGSPLLVQLFIIYYGLGQLEAVRQSFIWPLLKSPVNCAIIAVGLNSAAYTAELVAGAIGHVAKGQWEAAKALGIRRPVTLARIILPQAYRAILPALGNELILVMKGSTLASAVTVMEMTGAARVFVARTYAPFEAFIVAGLMYLLVGALFSFVFRGIERAVAIPTK